MAPISRVSRGVGRGLVEEFPQVLPKRGNATPPLPSGKYGVKCWAHDRKLRHSVAGNLFDRDASARHAARGACSRVAGLAEVCFAAADQEHSRRRQRPRPFRTGSIDLQIVPVPLSPSLSAPHQLTPRRQEPSELPPCAHRFVASAVFFTLCDQLIGWQDDHSTDFVDGGTDKSFAFFGLSHLYPENQLVHGPMPVANPIQDLLQQ